MDGIDSAVCARVQGKTGLFPIDAFKEIIT
jgi:hypothetical protein